MFKFVIKYGIWLSSLFILIYFDWSLFSFLNDWQTQVTISLTHSWIHFFNIPVQIQNNSLFYSHGLELVIVHSCNGMAPLLLFVSALMAYPSDWHNKIIWTVFAYFVISLANMARIYYVSYVVLESADKFHCAHNCYGRIFIGVVLLGMFYLFISKAKVLSGINSNKKR